MTPGESQRISTGGGTRSTAILQDAVIEIRLAASDEDVDRALALAEEVWGAPPLNLPVARALSLAGWYVALAHDDEELVGMCAGFVGLHDREPHLHSHLAAVRPGAQGKGIGRALKRHQREWCLERGIDTITWTFDPLVRENARFNLHHLGALGTRYLVDLYGPMEDDINHGQPSDRLLVTWELRTERTEDALDMPLPAPRADLLRDAGAADVLTGTTEPELHTTSAPVRLVATPQGIATLRRSEPSRALAWRLAVRDAMTKAFHDGLRATALADSDVYVLSEAPR